MSMTRSDRRGVISRIRIAVGLALLGVAFLGGVADLCRETWPLLPLAAGMLFVAWLFIAPAIHFLTEKGK